MQLIELFAGPLSMLFDRELAQLRFIRLGPIEVLRSIFPAVRDQDWNTIPFEIRNLTINQTTESFRLSLEADCHPQLPFSWRGEINGSAVGELRFRFLGLANQRFLKNRIGLCVLHPMDPCAGLTCRVEHVDGSLTHSEFPKSISPHQPFKQIRSIQHPVGSSFHALVTFSGEVFEMEDQRNWSDASFKTYSTPLELPFPVELPADTKIEHLVTLKLLGTAPQPQSPICVIPSSTTPVAHRRSNPLTTIKVDWECGRSRPNIGLGMSTSVSKPSRSAVDALRALRVDHLRVDVWLDNQGWRERFIAGLELAALVATRLELALFAAGWAREEWEHLGQLIAQNPARLARCLVFHVTTKTTPHDLGQQAVATLTKVNAKLEVGFGTNSYFAELNRERPRILAGITGVCYSINPQVHAFDNLSLRETLAAQGATVDTAHQIFGCPIIISPVTLLPRANPNATSSGRVASAAESVAPPADPRQPSGFTAAWTVGSLAALAAHPHIGSLTYFETWGPRGVLDEAGQGSPTAWVFKNILAFDRVYPTCSSRPLDIAALAVGGYSGGGNTNRRGLLLANMSELPQKVQVDFSQEPLQVEIPGESVKFVEFPADS